MSNIKIKRTDLIYSLFNENLYAEAKANIEIVTSYFRANDRDNKVVQTLLKFISKNDLSDVNPTKLSYQLSKVDTLIDEEIDSILDRIKYFVKLSDAEILKDYADKLRQSCISQSLINAQKEAGNDIEKYLELVQKFEYKSSYSEDMTVMRIGDVDVATAMKDSFSKFASSDLPLISDAYPSVNGWLSSQMVMVVGRPGGGKSLFMMRSTLELCKQGKRGLYVALGDLSPASFIIRCGAQLLGISLTEAARRSKACGEALKEAVGDNLSISCVPADTLTVSKFMKKTRSIIDEFDFIVVDYDRNFKIENSSNLYLEGGEIYSALSELTITHKKLVFVGCQPKQYYWDKSILPMSSGGESSRKMQFVDTMITIGVRQQSSLPLGYLNIAKNRNGSSDISSPYVRTSDGEFRIVPPKVYQILKDYKDRTEISWYELKQMVDNSMESLAMSGEAKFTENVKVDPDFFVAETKITEGAPF